MKAGTADLPLHPGKAPRWLFKRMVGLSEGIVDVMVHEYGRDEFLRRISDPFWFQCLSCVLGFDWHSSGTTTVTCGALKEAIDPQRHGIVIAGGKGKTSRRAPSQIMESANVFNISSSQLDEMVYASRMSAKVDNTAVQDFHNLYHHVFIFTEKGNWAVIQQGLNPAKGYARRYHWLREGFEDFVDEPHNSILGERTDGTLDMTSGDSSESRRLSVDLVKDNPRKIRNLLKSIRRPDQSSLTEFGLEAEEVELRGLWMPKNINWDALSEAYEVQPSNYEELIDIRGVGPRTIRALALIGELIYGEEASWRDPVKYSFTVGGKDGVPYPVDRGTMDRSIDILKSGVEEAKLGKREKLDALNRLRRFVPEDLSP